MIRFYFSLRSAQLLWLLDVNCIIEICGTVITVLQLQAAQKILCKYSHFPEGSFGWKFLWACKNRSPILTATVSLEPFLLCKMRAFSFGDFRKISYPSNRFNRWKWYFEDLVNPPVFLAGSTYLRCHFPLSRKATNWWSGSSPSTVFEWLTGFITLHYSYAGVWWYPSQSRNFPWL